AITSDADLTAAAEVISEQALGTGANESEFNNWTAYDFVKNTLSFENILNVQSTISFYPNPTNGVVNIDSETRVNEISVYAITGQLVKKAIGANSINIEEVRPGIYIIEVSTNEQKVQGKLIRK
ncbi:MAG: T9SS type A sorting domain-containing protein, partial [Flavobacteriaceae bacterium]